MKTCCGNYLDCVDFVVSGWQLFPDFSSIHVGQVSVLKITPRDAEYLQNSGDLIKIYNDNSSSLSCNVHLLVLPGLLCRRIGYFLQNWLILWLSDQKLLGFRHKVADNN